jgi:biopolymer transport protein ExbD
MSKKKKRRAIKYRDIELNIMPFIDVFSLLNTFLLMSAVFLSVGILEVQVPFLTSAPPEKKEEERSLDIKVDMEKDKIEVIAAYNKPPINEQKRQFKVDKTDIANLHKFLVELRRANPETDKIQFFTEDDVPWRDIAHVLDAIKVRNPNDPVFATKSMSDLEKKLAAEFLFPKVVMASVMLR